MKETRRKTDKLHSARNGRQFTIMGFSYDTYIDPHWEDIANLPLLRNFKIREFGGQYVTTANPGNTGRN